MISFSTIDVMMPLFDYDQVRSWICSVVEDRGFSVGELYYYYCSDDALLRINQDRLGHDFYTDIVTFPLNACESVISSEFCISLDRVAENALLFGRTFDHELFRVMIHGVLHLIGFDDLVEEDRLQMRDMEDKCLDTLFKQLNIN